MAPGETLILIVEDNPDQLRILAEMLRSAGYKVATSMGAEPGMRRAKTLKPDLILTDLAMPQVSGVQLIDQLRHDETTKHIPIVAVTAYVWDVIAQAAGNAGADGFISKPYTRARLVEEVEKHVGHLHKTGENAHPPDKR
jgi:two-component system, cell cycle response regulator DivK